MSSTLSSAEKETLVSSFLEIAVGQSIETAQHFLEATKWRIEDALQLYYTGHAEQSDASSSYFLPAKFTPLMSDYNHSTLEDNMCNVNAGQSDVAPTASLCVIDPMTHASPPNVARRKRRTHAEIVAATLASTGDHMCPVSALPIACPQQQTPALGKNPPQISVNPSSDDVVGTSRRTRSRSTEPTYSRQSKRLRALQQNCPLQEPSFTQSRPMNLTDDVAGPSRRSRAKSADVTYSRKSKRLTSIQRPTNNCLAIGEQNIPDVMAQLPLSKDCAKCGAIKLAFETPHLCCSNGQIHLVQNEHPSELLDLYGGMGDNAHHFRDYARMYNNTFAFNSLGGSAGATTQKGQRQFLKLDTITFQEESEYKKSFYLRYLLTKRCLCA